jgi:hypothetical protein
MRMIISLTLAVVLSLGASCSKEPSSTLSGSSGDNRAVQPSPSDIRAGLSRNTLPFSVGATEAESAIGSGQEAYLLAQWLANEMYAPTALAKKIESDLKIIRNQYSYTIEAVKIRFAPPHSLGTLLIGFTDEGWRQFKAGQYHAWDSLNRKYDLDSIDVPEHYSDELKMVSLIFRGLPNCNLLVDQYAGLAGLRSVGVAAWCCDWPLLLVCLDHDTLHYFFRNAWGDCPSGCIEQEFFYFTVEGSIAHYVGTYKHDWTNPPPRPDWMNMVDQAMQKYWANRYWTRTDQ